MGVIREPPPTPVAPTAKDAAGGLAEVFAAVGPDTAAAAAKLLGWLKQNPDPGPFADAARRLIFLKGRDAHDYKFSSAVLEDFANVSPAYRNQFLALSVFNLKGTSDKDSGLIGRTRAALEA